MSIMIDGCQNCHHDKSTHMPDGACLFEPTMYKPYPPLFVNSNDFVTVTGRLSSKEPNISSPPRSRPTSFMDKLRRFFR